MYNNPDALWVYNSNSSVVINFPNSTQYNQAKEMIDIADKIINSPKSNS